MERTFGELRETPVGPISFTAGDGGLQRVDFLTLAALKAKVQMEVTQPSLEGLMTVSTLLVELNEYLFGIRKFFTVRIDWDLLPDFQRRVLEAAATIPWGEVRSYGAIAAELGKPGGARAVGRALATNPMPIVIPCHRVVGVDGRLHGYAAPDGIQTKAFLLRLEGRVITEENCVS